MVRDTQTLHDLPKSQQKELTKDILDRVIPHLNDIISLADKYKVNPMELFEVVQATERRTVNLRPLDEQRSFYEKEVSKNKEGL